MLIKDLPIRRAPKNFIRRYHKNFLRPLGMHGEGLQELGCTLYIIDHKPDGISYRIIDMRICSRMYEIICL